ncbi:MAG: tandem-95 repeat protein, partial [Lentisphaeria bacterium]|nr:tandem-95 repeat protein [Lentisphaeria bacterium]
YAECGSGCNVGQKTFAFTIPVGAIVEGIGLATKLVGAGFALPLGAGLLIPDITVTLDTEFSGTAWLRCPPDYCPDGQLMMGVDLLLQGEAAVGSKPPLSSQFTAIIPVVTRLRDNSQQDTDLDLHNILTEWSYTEQNFQVGLSLPVVGGGEVALFPVSDSRGTGYTSCVVQGGCGDYETRPVIVSWPSEIVVPIGGEAHFNVVATMQSTTHPQLTFQDAMPYTVPLRYEVSRSRWPGVHFEITDDHRENGTIVPGGQATVRVDPAAQIPDGTTEKVAVTVCDSRDPLWCDMKPMTIRYVLNHPPEAISDGRTIAQGEGCFGPVHYKARDPDLPDNYGYQLFFDPLGYEGWDCSNVYMNLMYDSPGLIGTCSGQECGLPFVCAYQRCLWPSHPIPEGTYEFPFRVTEYNPWTKEYGFSSRGAWTLTVANQLPVITVDPSTLKVGPGDIARARVTATDPDRDTLTLGKLSGPGSFPTVTNTGSVAGTYTWAVPDPYRGSPWKLVGFKATDSCGATDLAYLLIHVRTPPRVGSGYVSVFQGETAATSVYVEDPDSDRLTFNFHSPDGIVAEVVGEEPVREYDDYGQGGRYEKIQVSVAEDMTPGRYNITVTAEDETKLTATGALTVEVKQQNHPPEVDPTGKEISRKGGGGPDAWASGMRAVLTAWNDDPPCFIFSDPDGDALIFGISSSRYGAAVSLLHSAPTFDNQGSHYRVSVLYAPPADLDQVLARGEHAMQDVLTVTGTDPSRASASARIVITLTDAPPEATAKTIEFHHGPVTIKLTASDPDDTNLGYTVIRSPTHGALTGRAPDLTYTPDPSFLQGGNEDYMEFSVTDGVLTNQATVTLVVVNAPPIAMADTATTHVATPVMIAVLTNDTDPDGDPLTLASVGAAGHGATAIAGDQVLYTPQPGYCGSDSFSYTVSDGYSGEASASVVVTVIDVTPPHVVTKDITVYLDATGNVTITPQDVDNGSTDNCGIASMSVIPDSFACADLGGNTVTLTVTDTSGNHASAQATVTVVDNLPPVLTVPPDVTIECGEATDPSHTGQATATDNCDSNPQVMYADTTSGTCPQVITRTWKATDSSGNSATGVQRITVEDTTPPELHCPGDVTADTHDPSGTTVTFTMTVTDTCDPSPTVMCTPASGSHFPMGMTTVTCEASDACGNTSSPCNFTVTVTFVNHPPNAVNDSATTPEDTAVTIAVLANDSDPDGDPLNVTSVTNPPHGTATSVGSQVRYTPDSGFSGTDSFTYTITDPYEATDSAQATVSVEHINHPPVAYDDEYFVPNWSQPVPLHLNADDPDGDPLTYFIVSGPDHGFLTGTAPDLTYHHTGGGIPVDWFTFRVFDGYDYSNIATIVIDPPVDTQ